MPNALYAVLSKPSHRQCVAYADAAEKVGEQKGEEAVKEGMHVIKAAMEDFAGATYIHVSHMYTSGVFPTAKRSCAVFLSAMPPGAVKYRSSQGSHCWRHLHPQKPHVYVWCPYRL